MGYTHYWSQREAEITDAQWEAICEDARALIRASPAPIGDAFGESPEWIVDGERIVFNGVGKDSHETFMLWRRGQDHLESWMDRALSPYGASFTKTARKPYDAVVCGVLMAVERHAPGWQRISSDGYADETIWLDALAFTSRVLGCGYTIPRDVESRGPRSGPDTAGGADAAGPATSADAGSGKSFAGGLTAGHEGPGDPRVFARVLSTLSSGLSEGLYFSEFEEQALGAALRVAGGGGVTGHMAYGLAAEIVAAHAKLDAYPGKSLVLVFCERVEELAELGRPGAVSGRPRTRSGIESGLEVSSPYGSAVVRYVSEDGSHAVIGLETGGERWIPVHELGPVAA